MIMDLCKLEAFYHKLCHVQHQKLLAETDIYLILNIRNVLIIFTACILLRILLICALKAHNNFHFWKKFSQKLKKY